MIGSSKARKPFHRSRDIVPLAVDRRRKAGVSHPIQNTAAPLLRTCFLLSVAGSGPADWPIASAAGGAFPRVTRNMANVLLAIIVSGITAVTALIGAFVFLLYLLL